ncbi:MAG TPA: hypothetical protein VGQ78_08795 [Vicinamibacteria bacterium]|nr:hypothetical protein [Vicinamibacteria bacterium]
MHRRAAVLFAILALFSAGPAWSGDVTAFLALPMPRDTWVGGYGAALTSTWFNLLSFEGEAARFNGNTRDTGMTSFTASAFLSPPIGGLIPYAGIGYGVFRQTAASDSDLGRLRTVVAGVKVRIKGLLVLKGEYRKYQLSGQPLLPLDARLAAGAGIAF